MHTGATYSAGSPPPCGEGLGVGVGVVDKTRAPEFIIPRSAPMAMDAERVGPKAANLAALTRAGLPTPGGFCLTADAYRAQMTALGLGEVGRSFQTARPA